MQVRARQEVLLPLSYRSPVAHRYLLVGVMACSGIDVAAQQLPGQDVLTGFGSEQSTQTF